MKNKIAKTVKERMSNRLWVIGSNENTEDQITSSFHNLLSKLSLHLKDRKYIFGDKPSYADFGLWGQIYNSWTDPTPRKFIEEDYPDLLVGKTIGLVTNHTGISRDNKKNYKLLQNSPNIVPVIQTNILVKKFEEPNFFSINCSLFLYD